VATTNMEQQQNKKSTLWQQQKQYQNNYNAASTKNDNTKQPKMTSTSIEVHLPWNSQIHGKCAFPSGLNQVSPW